MASASGTSVLGVQTLINNSTAPAKLFSVSFPGRVTPPVRRLGYFWLYQFETTVANPHYIVERGVIASPGIFFPIRISAFSASWLFRLDVQWNIAGIAWFVNIA